MDDRMVSEDRLDKAVAEIWRLRRVLHDVANMLDGARHAAQGVDPLANRLRQEAERTNG